MSFFVEKDLRVKQILEGIALRVISGEKTMMTFFEFEPYAVIPPHKHPHEQITYVIEGEMEFTVEDRTRVLKKGDGVVILANQAHHVRILDRPAKAVDAWYPRREDYL